MPAGFGLSHLLQSLPGGSGHGLHAPDEQFPGATHPIACSPILQPQLKLPGLYLLFILHVQRGPRLRGGNGSLAHVEALGLVPTFVKIPLIG